MEYILVNAKKFMDQIYDIYPTEALLDINPQFLIKLIYKDDKLCDISIIDNESLVLDVMYLSHSVEYWIKAKQLFGTEYSFLCLTVTPDNENVTIDYNDGVRFLVFDAASDEEAKLVCEVADL